MGDGPDSPFVIQAKVGERERYNWTKQVKEGNDRIFLRRKWKCTPRFVKVSFVN